MINNWRDSTKVVQDLDLAYRYDILNSQYANIKYYVQIQEVLLLTSKYEANLPGLAYDYYNDINYWRVLAAVNSIRDPISGVLAGAYLAMPTQQSVVAYLSRKPSGGPIASNLITL